MERKVIVVDDSGTMRKIIIRSLNALRIQDTVEAADGDEVRNFYQRHKHDRVLTELTWRFVPKVWSRT